MRANTIESTAVDQRPIENRLIFILSLAGLAIAAFLWWTHIAGAEIPCGGSSGCDDVAASPYSLFMGYPVAAFGSGLYLFLAGLSFTRALALPPERDRRLLIVIIAMAALGAAFSLWLTYLELFVIHAICRWCVASQIIILAILAIALLEWLHHSRRRSAN